MILNLESANTLSEISGIKKLSGYKTYYRVRLGDYRVGFEKVGDAIMLIILAHRKDIYGVFP